MNIDSATLFQFIRYTLTGILATLIHIILFHLIGWKVFPAFKADDHIVRLFKLSTRFLDDATRARNAVIGNCSAFLFANMVAYVTNILWVFHGGKYSFFMEILLFYLASGFSVILGSLLMGILIKRLGLLTTYAFSVNIVTAVTINYVVRKFIIFQG